MCHGQRGRDGDRLDPHLTFVFQRSLGLLAQSVLHSRVPTVLLDHQVGKGLKVSSRNRDRGLNEPTCLQNERLDAGGASNGTLTTLCLIQRKEVVSSA